MMTFEEARRHILAAIDVASSVLNEPRFASRLRDDSKEIEFQELELDSLTAMEICMDLEDRAGVEVEPGDLVAHPGVNALAKFIVTRADG